MRLTDNDIIDIYDFVWSAQGGDDLDTRVLITHVIEDCRGTRNTIRKHLERAVAAGVARTGDTPGRWFQMTVEGAEALRAVKMSGTGPVEPKRVGTPSEPATDGQDALSRLLRQCEASIRQIAFPDRSSEVDALRRENDDLRRQNDDLTQRLSRIAAAMGEVA